jgi:hypothetical protein
VVVKSEVVALRISVPVASERPLVLITLLIVGNAVPVGTFQNLTVAVPVSAPML